MGRLGPGWLVPVLPLELSALAYFRVAIGLCALQFVCQVAYWREEWLAGRAIGVGLSLCRAPHPVSCTMSSSPVSAQLNDSPCPIAKADSGICPRHEATAYAASNAYPYWLTTDDHQLTLYSAAGGSLPVGLLLLCHIVAAATVVVGYHSRSAALVAFLLDTALVHRLHCVAYGGDQLRSALLLWAACLPVGARHSIVRPMLHLATAGPGMSDQPPRTIMTTVWTQLLWNSQ